MVTDTVQEHITYLVSDPISCGHTRCHSLQLLLLHAGSKEREEEGQLGVF